MSLSSALGWTSFQRPAAYYITLPARHVHDVGYSPQPSIGRDPFQLTRHFTAAASSQHFYYCSLPPLAAILASRCH